MSEIASAFVSLVPSAKGFGSATESQINGEIGGSGRGIGSKLGAALKVGLLAGVAGVGAGFIAGFKDAIDYQKLTAQTNATLISTKFAAGVSAQSIQDLASEIAGYSDGNDDAIQAGANLILTFTNIRNAAGKGNDIFNQTTKAATDMAVALGTDVKTQALGLGKALNDPAKGYSRLQRSGVSFTDSQIKQIKTLQESGDVLGAQKVILGEVNKEFGGSAMALGNTFSGSVGRLKDTFGDLLRDAVLPLLPKIQVFVNVLARDLPGAVASLTGKIRAFVGFVRGGFNTLFGSGSGGSSALAALKDFSATLISKVGPALSNFGDIFRTKILPAVLDFAQSVKSAVLPVIAAAANTFQTKVLPAAISLGKYLAAKLFPVFKQIAGVIKDDVLPILSGLAVYFYSKVYPAVVTLVTALAKTLQPVFEAIVDVVSKTLIPAFQSMLQKFRENQPVIQRVVGYVGTLIGALLKLAAAILAKVLPPLIRFYGQYLSKLISVSVNVIVIIFKVIDALVKFGKGVVNVSKNVVQFVKNFINKVGQVYSYVKSIPRKILNALGNVVSTLVNKGGDFITGLLNGIEDKVREVVQYIKDLPGKLISAIGNLGKKLFKKGVEFVQGLIDGVKSKFRELENLIQILRAKLSGDYLGSYGGRKSTPGDEVDFGSGRGRFVIPPAEQRKTLTELEKFIKRINDLSLKGLKKLDASLTKQGDALKQQFDRIASAANDLATSVSDAFRPDLFSGSLADLFGAGSSALANLKAVKAAQDKLLGIKGLSKEFLSQLFASGNSGLILQLAGSSNSTIRDAETLFGQTSNIADQLGNRLSEDRYGAKLDTLADKLDEVKKELHVLAPRIARGINKAGHDGHKRKAHA